MSARGLETVRAVFRLDLARLSVGAIAIRATGAVFGFLFNVVLARTLGKEGTGALLFYLNFGTMVGLIATAGMDVVGLRELSRIENDPSRAQTRFAQVFSNALVSAVIFSAAGLAFLLWFGGSLAGTASWELCVGATFILFLTALQKCSSDWLIAIREFAASQFVFYFINRIATLMLLGLALVLAGPTPDTFCIVYAAGLLLAVLFGFRRLGGQFDWPSVFGVVPSLALMRDGISCGLQNAAFIALNLSPFVLLGALSSTSQLGIYGVSQRLVALMVLALTAISQFAMRDFARASGEREFRDLAHALTISARLTFVAAIPLTIGLVAFAPFLVLVFGKSFATAGPTLALLSCGICAQCLGMPFQAALLATNHERSARNVTLACAAAGIVLNAVLIPRWGGEGAAIGTGIGLALQSLGHAARALRLLPVRLDFPRFRIISMQVVAAQP
jgi:O-antigen/teichoic acid export membrane protein